ncbi:Basic-leucine zipper domain, partial [Globisporangium splendens]
MSSSSQIPSIKVEPGQQQQQQQRGRRKRVAIEIPADVDLENMDPKEVKKIKNRIAAARLRERSQQQIRELEATIQYYKSRAEYLEGVTAHCPHCSNLAQMQLRTPQRHASSLAGSQCNSPTSSADDDLTLDDIDCDLLENLLLMAD